MDEIRYREFALRADCQRDPEGLAALDRLGWDTFRLKLRAWYETGCWQEGTRALTLFREREAVSSLFASSMELSWQGRQIPAVQIGGVMTAPPFRGQGCSRRLMEQVLALYPKQFVFLYANDTVREFYPRFGFEECPEYERQMPIASRPGKLRRIDPRQERALLEELYRAGNPWAALSLREYPEVFLFNCFHGWAEDLWLWEEAGVLGAVRWEGARMYCGELLGASVPLGDALAAFARPETRTARLGFAAAAPAGAPVLRQEKDTTLFIRPAGVNPFASDKLCLSPLGWT